MCDCIGDFSIFNLHRILRQVAIWRRSEISGFQNRNQCNGKVTPLTYFYSHERFRQSYRTQSNSTWWRTMFCSFISKKETWNGKYPMFGWISKDCYRSITISQNHLRIFPRSKKIRVLSVINRSKQNQVSFYLNFPLSKTKKKQNTNENIVFVCSPVE